MKYIVYQTVNIQNGKIYIGVHKTLNPDKFDGYLGNGVYVNKSATYMNPKTPFQFAVKKYGVNNFKRIVLFVYDSEEDAYAKEENIVDLDFIKNKNTYNIAIGGNIPRRILSYPIHQFNSEGILVKSWDYLQDASDFFNVASESFYNAIRCKEKLHGFYWSRNKEINIEEYSNPTNKVLVYQYDQEGNCLAMFNSIYEASKITGLESKRISEAIKMQSLVNGQYYYSSKLYDVFTPSPRKSLKNTTVYLYTLQGDFIKEFKKVSELQKYLNVNSYNVLYRAIHGQNGIYKDYQILLEFKGDKIDKAESKKTKPKQIDVYDLTGNLLETCDSIQEASKKYNVKTSGINRVIRGVAKTSGGYIFKKHN